MPANPELLSLLSGKPSEFAKVVADMQAADFVEALRDLTPVAAGRVIAALPFDLAVQVLDDPEIEHRGSIIQTLDTGTAGALLNAMSADQQATVFRDLPQGERSRLLPALHRRARGGAHAAPAVPTPRRLAAL